MSETRTRGRWRRRLARLALALVVLALALRAALPFALPHLLTKLARPYDLDVRYEKLQLSLLGGSFELWNLELLPLSPKGEPAESEPKALAHLEFATVDADVSALLGGDLAVHRLEVDGLDLWLERDADGAWSFERHLPEPTDEEEGPTDTTDTGDPGEATPNGEAAAPRPFALALPFVVTSTRLQHVRVHLADERLAEPIDSYLELGVRVSHLGSTERPMRLEVQAHSPLVLDALRIEGEARGDGTRLEAELETRLSGLRLGPLSEYLEPLGIRPAAEALALTERLSLAVEPVRDADSDGDGTDGADDGPASTYALRAAGGLELRADLETSASVAALELEAPRITLAGVELARVQLSGLTGAAERLADGTLRVAGLDLIGAPPAGEAEEQADEEEAGGAPFVFELGQLSLADATLRLTDRAVEPTAELELNVERLALEHLVVDPARPAEELRFEGAVGAPGLARSMTWQGTATPFDTERRFDLELAADGLAPERLAPYLGPLGLESTFVDGSVATRVTGRAVTEDSGALRIDAELTDLTLRDEDEWFGVERLGLDGLLVDSEAALVRLELAELRGTRLALERDADRSLHLFGLRTVAPTAAPASTALRAESPAAPPAPPEDEDGAEAATRAEEQATPLRIEIERVAWSDTAVRVDDRALEPPLSLRLDDMGLELERLAFGGSAAELEETAPARLRLFARAEGIADELSLEGTIASRPGPLDVDLDLALTGRGLTLETLAPYLLELGLESRLDGASFDAAVRGGLRREADTGALRGSLALSDVALANGQQTPLSMKRLAVADLVVSADAVRVASIDIDEPRLELARDAQGGLLAAGLRVRPPDPDAVPETETETGPGAAAAGSPAAGLPVAGAAADPGAAPSPTLALDRLTLAGASVRWRDAMVSPAVDTELALDGSIRSLELGTGAPTASFDLNASLAGVLERGAIEGTATLDPDDLRARVELAVEGLRAGPLGAYLPEQTELTLTDGRLSGALELRARTLEAGGRSLALELGGVDYRDGGAAEPFLTLDRLALDVPRFDPEGGEITVAELTSSGLELAARRTGASAFELLGLRLDGGAASSAPGTQTEAGALTPADEPVDELADETKRTPVEAEVDAPPPLVARALRRPDPDQPLPTIRLERLEVGLQRLHFQDETSPGAAPFELGAILSSDGPLTLLAPEPEALDPIELRLSGQARPVVGAWSADLRLSPYAVDPGLDVELAASGIRGAGLTEVLPDLAERLDGSGLDGATLSAKLESILRVRRRSPVDFDLGAGFGAELSLTDLALRAGAGPEGAGSEDTGTVLAGLDGVYVDVREVRPASGDVHVKTIEIDTPRALLSREPEGLRALGLLLLNPPEAEAEGGEATELAEAPSTDEAPADTPAAGDALAAGDAPELRIDELVVTGIDVLVRDEAVEPPMVLPFNDLELELKRFTTRALTEPIPIQFRSILATAPIDLPPRDDSSLVGGILGAAAGLVTGGPESGEVEQRPAFGEIATTGRLTLYPHLKGYTKLDVRALELVNFRGPATEAGVDLSDGVLDTEVDVRFRGEEGLSVRSKTTLSHLSVSEPPGGPISRLLILPAPLDTVLYVLRDENEEQVLPLSFKMGTEGLSGGAVASAAVAAIGRLVGEAIASSPVRIIGGVLDFTGLDQEQAPIELSAESVPVPFAPGATALGAEALAAAEPVFEAMRADPSLVLVVQHRLGAGDLTQVARLSNPSTEDCLALAERLRQTKFEQLARRDELAGEIRARYAIGQTEDAAEATEPLRALDRELASTEAALDELYELLRPGAERRRDRRVRAAALAVAQLRLESVRRGLLEARVPKMAVRVQLRRPRFELVELLEEGGDGMAQDEAGGGVVTLTPLRRR